MADETPARTLAELSKGTGDAAAWIPAVSNEEIVEIDEDPGCKSGSMKSKTGTADS